MNIKKVFLTENIKKKFKKVMDKGLKAGFFHLLSANILLQIAGFGGQIFLTRVLPVEDIGRIRILQSFLSIIVMIATFGMNTTLLKVCSEDISRKEKNILLKTSIFLGISISVIIVIATALASTANILSNDDVINKQMGIYIFQIPFLVLNSLGMAYLQSQQKIREMSNVQIFSKLFIILVSTVAAFIFGLAGYVTGILVSNIIASGLLFILLKEELKNFKFITVDKFHVTKLLRFSSYTFGTALFWQIMLSSGVIIASYVSDNKEHIAYYGNAQLIVNTLMMIPITLNQIMTPKISKESANLFGVKNILKNYQRLMFVLMSIVIVASYFVIPWLIPLVFGEAYIEAIPYFKILLIGLFFWSLYSPKNNVLFSIGRVDYTFYSNALTCIISITLNMVFVVCFGIIGLAISNLVTFIMAIIINEIYYKRAFRGI